MKNEIIKKIESILEKKKISYENLKFLAGDASNRKYFNIKIKGTLTLFLILTLNENQKGSKTKKLYSQIS